MRVIYVLQFASKPCVRMRKVIDSLEENGYKVYFCGINRGDGGNTNNPQILHFGISAKRGSWIKIFALPFFIYSMVKFLIKSKANRVYCADFEAGLCGALYSTLTKSTGSISFVYDVLDTYSERYKTLKVINRLINALESKVANISSLLIHVDDNRVSTLKTGSKSHLIVKNVPSLRVLPKLKQPTLPRPNSPIRVLVSGGIYEHRGVRSFLNLMSDEKFKKSVQMKVIGFGDEKLIRKITSMNNCSYLGYVDSKMAQALSLESDLILSLYDPSSEINRLACPNKVYDGAANGTFVLVNKDIINKSSFSAYPNLLVCDYDDPESIKNQVYSIYNRNANTLYDFSKEFRKSSLWENEFYQVIKHYDQNL